MTGVYDSTSDGHCSLLRLQEKQDESEDPSIVGKPPNSVNLKRSNEAFKDLEEYELMHLLSPEKEESTGDIGSYRNCMSKLFCVSSSCAIVSSSRLRVESASLTTAT